MDTAAYQIIRDNYRQVLEQIEKSASLAGRDAKSVKLVVVTKGHPAEAVRQAVEAGARVFGENYAEEGVSKKEAIIGERRLEWHMIGHIQSRKARLVVEHYDFVHSLDSVKLAKRLDSLAAGQGVSLPVLLEVNISGEDSKYGWTAADENSCQKLVDEFGPIVELENLEIRGLMTMAPFLPDAEDARPYFRRLRRLRDNLAGQFPRVNWRELSMGMSADFKVAVQEGATLVRVGTAILGYR